MSTLIQPTGISLDIQIPLAQLVAAIAGFQQSVPEEGAGPPDSMQGPQSQVPPTSIPNKKRQSSEGAPDETWDDRNTLKLSELTGKWTLVGPEASEIMIQQDGSTLYGGEHLGTHYDILEKLDRSTWQRGIVHGDGWAVDAQLSTPDFLVWRKDGEADIEWERLPKRITGTVTRITGEHGRQVSRAHTEGTPDVQATMLRNFSQQGKGKGKGRKRT